MIDITTCDYKNVIENYDLLDIEDSEITKKRVEYLYNQYNKCTEKQIKCFIMRIENIFATRFSLPFYFENVDKMIEDGKEKFLGSKNKERLGECLPIILVLEKELQNIINPKQNVLDGMNAWILNYLKKYDKRLDILKDNYDEYDVLYAYSKIGLRNVIFKTCVFGLKIEAVFAKQKKK